MATLNVKVKPGRVAFDAPSGGRRITASDTYAPIRDTPYVRRLIEHWGDLELEGSTSEPTAPAVADPVQPTEPTEPATPTEPTTPAAPTITSIAPATATLGADAPITITGTGFAANSTVNQDGAPVTPFAYVSATEMTATLTSPASAGDVQVTVDTGGQSSNASAVSFA